MRRTQKKAQSSFQTAVDPNHSKGETTYFFEYSTEGSTTTNTLGGTVETVGGAGTIPAEEFGERSVESVPTEGLGTTPHSYYYRIVATNETGTTYGKVDVYTIGLPIVSGGSASGLTPTSATLEADVYPDFHPTKYGFEYATSLTTLEEGNGAKAFSATELPGGEVEPPTPVSLDVTGLIPYEHYYFRAIAENRSSMYLKNANEGRPILGMIGQFETRSLALPSTGEALSVTRTTAALTGSVIAPFVSVTYYYEYVNDTDYQAALAKHATNPYAEGETTSPVILPASETPQTAGPIQAGGLLPETTYDYRLVARNEFGWSYGADQTFRTPSKVLPIISTGTASAVSQNGATLSGTVSTNGLQTEYGFEIATEPADYGTPTGLGSISGSLTETVTATLGELQPGTTYYYRLTATNADGTVYSQPVMFATPGFPVLLTPQTSLPEIPVPSIAFPTTSQENTGTVKAKTLSKAQKLANALKACKKQKKSKRAKL